MSAQIFRQHHRAPEGVRSPVYRQMTTEWADLHQLAATLTIVRRWGRVEPALAEFASPGEIVDAIDTGDPETKDELLIALVRLFQNGQQLAGRTVLQALLPKLARMAGHTSFALSTASDDTWAEDRRCITIAEFWDVLTTYPTQRRPRRVAANLAFDTLHRVSGQRLPPMTPPIDPVVLNTTTGTELLLAASQPAPKHRPLDQ